MTLTERILRDEIRRLRIAMARILTPEDRELVKRRIMSLRHELRVYA